MPYCVEVTRHIPGDGDVTTYHWFQDEGQAERFAQHEADNFPVAVRYRWAHPSWRERSTPGGTGPYIAVGRKETRKDA